MGSWALKHCPQNISHGTSSSCSNSNSHNSSNNDNNIALKGNFQKMVKSGLSYRYKKNPGFFFKITMAFIWAFFSPPLEKYV